MGLLQKQDKQKRLGQTACKQCGICCTKGGAALHSGDLLLVHKGVIPHHDLITIRKGEYAHNPLTERVQPTKAEIVKLRGTGREWTCCYFDSASNGCTIYNNRPIACRTLKCWDPEDSLALVETDLLSRHDILANDESLLELIHRHETTCPLPEFELIEQNLKNNDKQTLTDLENLMNEDLNFRNTCVESSAIVAAEEMFLLGRPLFQLLHQFDLNVFQSGNYLRLRWMKKENGKNRN